MARTGVEVPQRRNRDRPGVPCHGRGRRLRAEGECAGGDREGGPAHRLILGRGRIGARSPNQSAVRARRATLAALPIAALLALAPGAQAATITVKTTADQFGAGAACSLREAVNAANLDNRVRGLSRGHRQRHDRRPQGQLPADPARGRRRSRPQRGPRRDHPVAVDRPPRQAAGRDRRARRRPGPRHSPGRLPDQGLRADPEGRIDSQRQRRRDLQHLRGARTAQLRTDRQYGRRGGFRRGESTAAVARPARSRT